MIDRDKGDIVRSQAFKSIKWAVLGEITARLIQPVLMLILVRFLSPADFGVVGIALSVISFVQIFQDFGLGKTLIQRENRVNESANTIFWINIMLSVFMYLLLFLGAPLLADFFHEPKVASILRILCLQVVMLSFVTVHQALSQREFKFRELFLIKLFSMTIPSLISIPLALYGYGVWALIWSVLASTVVQIVFFWKYNHWRPKFNIDFILMKELLGFGIWVTVEAFLLWVITWGDSIILGHFLGIKALGVYQVGIAFVVFIFSIVFNSFIPVSYSLFARFQTKHDELKRIFLDIVRMIAAISLPIGIGLALLSPVISPVIFGYKWQGIEFVIGMLGLMYGIGWIVGLNNEMYKAIGRPDINTKLAAILVFYYVPICILSAPHGLFVFCMARLILGVSSLVFYLYFTKKILKLHIAYIWEIAKIPLIGSIFVAGLLYPVVYFSGTSTGLMGWIKLISIVIIGGIGYFLFLWFGKRKLVFEFINIVKECLR